MLPLNLMAQSVDSDFKDKMSLAIDNAERILNESKKILEYVSNLTKEDLDNEN